MQNLGKPHRNPFSNIQQDKHTALPLHLTLLVSSHYSRLPTKSHSTPTRTTEKLLFTILKTQIIDSEDAFTSSGSPFPNYKLNILSMQILNLATETLLPPTPHFPPPFPLRLLLLLAMATRIASHPVLVAASIVVPNHRDWPRLIYLRRLRPVSTGPNCRCGQTRFPSPDSHPSACICTPPRCTRTSTWTVAGSSLCRPTDESWPFHDHLLR